jgi:predicted nucleotidyltransferase
VPQAPKVSPALSAFLGRLERELRPERVILFGSRARGDHRGTSDYDMLIVAKAFRSVPWAERAGMVMRLWDLPLDLEAICLTPEEFRRRAGDLTVVGVAAREGAVVYP